MGRLKRAIPLLGRWRWKRVGWAFLGAFCSASLIAPQWVLTAAHCIDGAREQAGELGFSFNDWHVHFVVGSNAQFSLKPVWTFSAPIRSYALFSR